MCPTSQIDIFSPQAYLDDAEVARRAKQMRAQGPLLWIEQAPYRPFWAVLRNEDIRTVERDNKTWLAEPRLTLIPSDAEDAIIAQWGKRTGPVRTLLDMDEPDHRKFRGLTQSWFNGRFLDGLRDRMTQLAT